MKVTTETDLKISMESTVSRESLCSTYLRTPNIQAEKLTETNFKSDTLKSFYDSVEVSKVQDLPYKPSNLSKIHDIFDTVEKKWGNSSGYIYGIVDNKTNEYIGHMSINNIDWTKNTAVASIYIPDDTEKISEIVQSILHIGFANLGVELITINSPHSTIQSEEVNTVVKENNGEYEGIERCKTNRSKYVIRDRWSMTINEYKGDGKYNQDGIKF